MLKKRLIAILFILLLTACGQGGDINNSGNAIGDTDIAGEETDDIPVTAENDDTDTKKKKSTVDAGDKSSNKNAERNENTGSDNESPESLTTLNVYYMDVGQADATLFRFDGYTILYDTGDWNRNDVLHYLDAQGVKDIDLVIISHPHADHIGQLEGVMHTYNVH